LVGIPVGLGCDRLIISDCIGSSGLISLLENVTAPSDIELTFILPATLSVAKDGTP